MFSHGATAASRIGAFPNDEGLEDGQAARIAALADRLPRADRILTSPARAAVDTASALGLAAEEEAMLGDLDFGCWRGWSVTELFTKRPEDAALWRNTPEAAPHGGESIARLIVRIGAWLDGLSSEKRVLAVTHGAVMRAALIHVLAAPSSSFWTIDIEPLSALEFSHDGRRWAWRCVPLAR
jgi:broad specificity phosphatase PhoE